MAVVPYGIELQPQRAVPQAQLTMPDRRQRMADIMRALDALPPGSEAEGVVMHLLSNQNNMGPEAFEAMYSRAVQAIDAASGAKASPQGIEYQLGRGTGEGNAALQPSIPGTTMPQRAAFEMRPEMSPLPPQWGMTPPQPKPAAGLTEPPAPDWPDAPVARAVQSEMPTPRPDRNRMWPDTPVPPPAGLPDMPDALANMPMPVARALRHVAAKSKPSGSASTGEKPKSTTPEKKRVAKDVEIADLVMRSLTPPDLPRNDMRMATDETNFARYRANLMPGADR